MLLMPNRIRPASNTANVGAQLCRKMNSVARASVAAVSHLGEHRDNAQLRGIARAMLPQCEAEPSKPCRLGDRSKSALIAGSKIPSVFNTMKEDTLENSQSPITTQR